MNNYMNYLWNKVGTGSSHDIISKMRFNDYLYIFRIVDVVANIRALGVVIVIRYVLLSMINGVYLYSDFVGSNKGLLVE